MTTRDYDMSTKEGRTAWLEDQEREMASARARYAAEEAASRKRAAMFNNTIAVMVDLLLVEPWRQLAADIRAADRQRGAR